MAEKQHESVKPTGTKNFNKNKNIINKRVSNENHRLKKRPPPRFYSRENDIYITNKSNFKAQLNQCEKILNSEIGEVYLHCLGNAITRGINLGLNLQKNSNGIYGLEVNTSTIELIDDFHPLRDDDDYTIQKRMNSCVHVKVYRHSKIAQVTKAVSAVSAASSSTT